MTADASLLERLFALTRGDLDNAVFPVPQPSLVLSELECVRITRLSRFWETERGASDALLQHSRAILAALHTQNSAFAFALLGIDRGVECWMGAQKDQFSKSSLASLLRGALPDVRIDDHSTLSVRTRSYPNATVFAGTPSFRTDDGRPLDQIESAGRGLAGRDWMFIVHARPRPAPHVTRSINEVAREIHDIRATRLLGNSPMGGADRTAERYVELLETKLRRLELGRTEGLWDVQISFLADTPVTLAIGRGLIQSAFSGEDSLPDAWRACRCDAAARTVPSIEPLSSSELAIVARLPHEEYPGYELVEATRFGVDVPAGDGAGIFIGDVADRGALIGKQLIVPADDLTRHALVAGVTGSGKTTSCLSLLQQATVPFLVIESAKSEYRDLLRRFPDLRVFTVGDDTVSPLRLNPFEVPPGVLVQTHIDYVKSLFSAAFVLYPPMPYVLEQSIQEIYEDRGWDLARNENMRGTSPRAFPRLSDLAIKIGDVVDRMGYDTRITMDVKAGLLARVNQLRLGGGKGLMLDCRTSTRASDLFDSSCLLELKSLVLDDEKAFVIGLLLIRLYEHCETTRRRGSLQHITIIEEAHRLLRNTSFESGPDTANPRGRAVEVFTNILSEVRAYGEGIVIAEQIPAKLTPDAIKNSGTKIVHRLVAQDDRELVGAAMNLTPEQIRGLARLATGEAVAYTERLQKPVLLRMRRSADPSPAPLTDGEVAAAMRARGTVPKDAAMTRPRIDGKEIRAAFRRLVNALRFAPAAAGEVHEAVLRELRLLNPRGGWEPWAAIAQLAEDECETRGAFFGWPFDAVDAAVSALLDDIHAVQERVAPRRFAEVAARLHARAELPFAGCVQCKHPCHYRFDIVSDSRDSSEFRDAFLRTGTSFATLASIAQRAADGLLPRRADEARREAALCFASSQLHRLQISSHAQMQSAASIAIALNDKGEPNERA